MTHEQTSPPKRLAAPPPRRPSRTAIRATFLVGASLLSGFVFRTPPAADTALALNEHPPAFVIETPAPAPAPSAELTSERLPAPPVHIHIEEYDPPMEDQAEAPTEERHSLASVGLDPETQEAIWTVCREDPRLFCMVMAMAEQETHFDSSAIGDHGNSIGLLQVQPRWHQERIDRLGVTDLKDPVQNAMVAVDYIDWIAERLNPEHPEDAYGTHSLLMAYNQGWQGANESWSAGRYSTNYSRKVLDLAATYLTEMEGWQ